MPRDTETPRQLPLEKAFFALNRGLNTEASPLRMPEGTSVAESNFELLRDGTRRRRKAVAAETGGSTYLFPSNITPDVGSVFSSFQWDNVNADPNTTFQVVKIGGYLHFYRDGETLSATGNKLDDVINIAEFTTTGDQDDVINNAITFASSQGHLFVSGRYLTPLRITYDETDDTFQAVIIKFYIRDFSGIADGVGIYTKPSTLSADHKYNLLNRGWQTANIVQFQLDIPDQYPAKNMIPWMGYSRRAEAGKTASNTEYDSRDWTKSYSSDKIEAEVFGNASAPQGTFFLDPFDTSFGILGVNSGDIKVVSATATTNPGYFWLVTLIMDNAHGLIAGDEFTLEGGKYIVKSYYTGLKIGEIPMSGTYVAQSSTSGTTIKFLLPCLPAFDPHTSNSVWEGETTLVTVTYPRSNGYTTTERPEAVGFFAGRTVYAGINHPQLADVVIFSQVVLSADDDHDKYGHFYQQYDPTSEHLSQVLPSDGGTIQIPGLSGAKAVVPLQNALLVFSRTGVYEISGGNNYFSAVNYNVRKISDVEVLSSHGVMKTDAGVIFTSKRGIYAIVTDTQTGFLTATSLTDRSIQTLWNSISDYNQEGALIKYDDALKKVYVLYRTATGPTNYLSQAVVWDEMNQAWYKLDFPGITSNSFGATYLHGVLATEAGDNSNRNKKLKFFVVTTDISASTLTICDMDHESFVDFNEDEMVPYIEFAYDGIGSEETGSNFSRKRQAAWLYTYLKRTETGLDEETEEWINTSSVWVEGRYEWTDSHSSKRTTSSQQVYAKPLFYEGNPAEDGYPVIVTKRKLRGRGHSVHVKYYGEEGKDAHILGYSIVYNVDRNP